MRTDKNILNKGIRTLLVTVLLMFVGPTLFYIATTNPEKPLYIPLLIVSLLLCAAAVFFAFRGLKTIMQSMFDSEVNSD